MAEFYNYAFQKIMDIKVSALISISHMDTAGFLFSDGSL